MPILIGMMRLLVTASQLFITALLKTTNHYGSGSPKRAMSLPVRRIPKSLFT